MLTSRPGSGDISCYFPRFPQAMLADKSALLFFSMKFITVWTTLFIATFVGTAQGANVVIDDTNADGTITITWVDFEGGFVVNGQSYAPVPLHVVQTVR